MTKKLFSYVLFSLFVFSVFGFAGINNAQAQVATFPAGCGSALGYSSTTGNPCSGTSTVINRYMAGCDSALGYSATTGAPCSGGPVAIQWLAGCTSTIGYSAVSGDPCNGTMTATVVVVPPSTIPGLPSTGMGGNATNIMLVLVYGLLTAMGFGYVIKHSQYAKK